MDLLCDEIVEEILLRLPGECVVRLGAAARRYNAITLSPEFVARYTQLHSPYLSRGFFLRRTRRVLPSADDDSGMNKWESFAFFLASSAEPEPEPAFSVDMDGFLPASSARRGMMGYQQDSTFIVHSSAGLLLCCRGRVNRVHYYVCDPVALRWTALPELPRPSPNEQAGLLSVTADDAGATIKVKQQQNPFQFQVVLFDQRRQWGVPGGGLDLEVFSSATGQWTATRVPYPPDFHGFQCFTPPAFLGQSGTTAYWLGLCPGDKAVAYDTTDHSLRLIPVPGRASDVSALNRILGERRGAGGGLRYAHFDDACLEVWDLRPPYHAHAQWTLVHRVALEDAVGRSPGTSALCSGMLRPFWSGAFNLIGFDPAHDDVVFMEMAAPELGCLLTYSVTLGTLGFRCRLGPGLTFAPFDMLPYQPPRPV